MPELPELQFTIQNIHSQIIGRTVINCKILHPKVCRPEPEFFTKTIENRRIIGLSRHGKWMIINMEPSLTMLLHLRMSGRLTVQPKEKSLPKYCVAALHLDNEKTIAFSDPRKFGRILLPDDIESFFGKLGPDALSPNFSISFFREGLQKSRQRIKTLLLSQRLVAGLGNIYTDEICFAAAVHPAKIAGTLKEMEIFRLYSEMKRILPAAIEAGGTSFDAVWAGGAYQKQLQVFHREGKTCPRCSSIIQKITLAGRGTHFCPKCQSL